MFAELPIFKRTYVLTTSSITALARERERISQSQFVFPSCLERQSCCLASSCSLERKFGTEIQAFFLLSVVHQCWMWYGAHSADLTFWQILNLSLWTFFMGLKSIIFTLINCFHNHQLISSYKIFQKFLKFVKKGISFACKLFSTLNVLYSTSL